ncbi:MAG: MMPL family transporter, partial [Actinomycetota bacterium]|nr:MMPL family transporter [Actinomycetota bacterium]
MLTALSDRIGARPRRSLLAVGLFVLVAGVFGAPVAGVLEDSGGFAPPDAGSSRAVERINGASGTQSSARVVLLVRTPQGAGSPAARARVASLQEVLAREPGVVSVATAKSSGDPAFVSRDRSSTFLAVTLAADASDDAVAERLTERFEGQDDIVLGGSLFAQTQIGERIGADLARAELLAFPLLLILSLLFFRGRATVLPLVVGITTVLGTFLALRAINEAYGLSIFALNLVIGLGLGLAIDYTLFLVSRYREELERLGPGPAAVRATMQTAGRTVVFSAATVAIALITLTVFPLGFAKSMGIAGAVVAVVAGVASLVITPALFSLWGAKLAVKRRRRERTPEEGGWYRLSHAVMRRPVLVAVATTLVMVAVSLPSLRAEFTPVDSTVIPLGESSRTVADTLQRDFPGQGTSPVVIALDAPRGDAAEVRTYASGLKELPGVKAVSARPLDASTWQVD